jgi:hypothetical protein
MSLVTAGVRHRFNHDLLIDAGDQKAARTRWPQLSHVLIDEALIARFVPHERRARLLKQVVHATGTLAVVSLLAALLGYVADLWLVTHGRGDDAHAVAIAAEVCAIAALTLALIASRYGPVRRRWLKHRFVAEVLRQWHFRNLLDGGSIERSVTDRAAFGARRRASLEAFLDRLESTPGAHMDSLSQHRRDPIGPLHTASLPVDAGLRAELLEAYQVLRLEHQRLFAIHKLSPDDRTFLGLSLSALAQIAEHVASATLVLALAVSVARLIVPFDWAPFAALSLAVAGVAVRTWRDGVALHQEHDRYHEMLHELELFTARWASAVADDQRLEIAGDVEHAALDECRTFIRSHERAQFVA